ncbi:MAG: hypothetical protein AAF490_14155 [Chloroflexota bacterium]
MFQAPFFRQTAFKLSIISTIQFVVLTTVAMLFYPGGSTLDENSQSYSFFTNFFSELGLTETYIGEPNTVSALLFFIALNLSGLTLILFFISFKQFFKSNLVVQIVSSLGMLIGIISGISFMGVAFTPANLYIDAHVDFVFWAFGSFPIAVILFIIAIFLERSYPNKNAGVFIVFAVSLIAYYLLLSGGPSIDTLRGLQIQVTGQKLIAYATVVSTLVQSIYALRQNSEPAPSGSIELKTT